jgi:ABC-type transport system involved in multi-copper enzyme maturation permease subunit
MPPLPSPLSLLLWAQAQAQGQPGLPAHRLAAAAPPPADVPVWLQWCFAWGEPSITIPGLLGAFMAWLKIVGLFCLLAWVLSWVVAALKEPALKRNRLFDWAALGALLVGLGTSLLRVLEVSGRIPRQVQVGGLPLVLLMAVLAGVVIFAWLELQLWAAIRRLGTGGDLITLGALHVALVLGLALAAMLPLEALSMDPAITPKQADKIQAIVSTGARLAGTYMGLIVLARVTLTLLPELLALRARRIYSIAWHTWIESFRRMWAPWVAIIVFAVILAFTSWFLKPPRDAEMGRLYVGTLALLCSLLLTVTVGILAPISLPNDIRQQTIYTVVSKPVRRLELIWGRMLGLMGLVTVLLLVFGGISLVYVNRMVGGAIAAEQALAQRQAEANHPELERIHREAADQLRSRMSARLPVRGFLTFVDSKSQLKKMGIDVGQELEYRSFIEGATPSRAIWQYGDAFRDPFEPQRIHSRPIDVAHFLRADSIEGLMDRIDTLKAEARMAQAAQAQAKQTKELGRAASNLGASQTEIKRLETELAAMLKREQSLRAAGKPREAARMHSRPITLEMNFNIYRTTKGEIGEPVYASMDVINSVTGQKYQDVFPIREYYNNKRYIPARYFAGSGGRIRIEMGCLTPNQYLGMAESDLYILADQGGFELNFMKGLFGIWLQAMVLTAIGVWAGTFLSWPVALLTTIGFFVGGQIGFGFLQQFAFQGLIGGGPFEALIRLLAHDNLQSDLTPTVAVIVAKTFDSMVMPIMSRLVYVVPNFAALDVSNVVSEGFAVTWPMMIGNFLLALAYAMPFSIAGYFILKHREVAA